MVKTFSKISLAANVILALVVVWLVDERQESPERRMVVAQSIPSMTARAEVAETKPTTVTPEKFRWSQLVASDYRIFIENLREVGCPESDIRSIVTTDADQAFAFQRRALHLTGAQAGPWSSASEQRLIASLLGEPPPTAGPGPEPEPTSVARQDPRPWLRHDSAPVPPLIFQPMDQLNLTDVQKQVLGQLQQQFLNEVGGPDQDPSDPAYLARWQAAQPKIDQSLKGLLGSQFYLKLQLLASGYLVTP